MEEPFLKGSRKFHLEKWILYCSMCSSGCRKFLCCGKVHQFRHSLPWLPCRKLRKLHTTNRGGAPGEDREKPGRWLPNRELKPRIIEFNRRQDRITKDEKIRYGEESITRRSDFLDWNYASELSAFSARIRETFDAEKLSEAFLNPSYVESEMLRQKELGMEEATLQLNTNERLAQHGQDFANNILLQYIRATFPYVPEEGISAFLNHVMSLDTLANISFHIGTRDLIKSEEYPPYKETYMRTLLAIVGALAEDSPIRATRLVIDLMGSQLHVQDINQLWDLEHPMKILTSVLENDQEKWKGERPESRLIWVSGKDTMFACFHVGIYCNKEIIGQAQGETAEVAEDMAARDALRRLFRTHDSRPFLPLGDEDLAKLDFRSKPNLSLHDWAESKVQRMLESEKQAKKQQQSTSPNVYDGNA